MTTMTDIRLDASLEPGLLFRRRVALIRLSFCCEQCGAEHTTERRYTAIRRFLDRSARNELVPYLRCPCCKRRGLRQSGHAEFVERDV